MAQIGTAKVQTPSGPVELPVFDLADAGSSVHDMVRVHTASGAGFIPFTAPADAAYPYLRIQTQNYGTLAAHNEAALAILDDHFDGSAGTSLGSNWLISQGIRKTRNTDTTTFTFQEDGNSNLEMSHDGSGSNYTHGEVAADLRLSNSSFVVEVFSWSWTYNSEENNIRMGIVDRTDNTNFIEFEETETSGVSPQVSAQNVNSSLTSNGVSFTGGVAYDWRFEMNSGTMTVYKDGSQVMQFSGYPAGDYTWFMYNENDSDTTAAETTLVDRVYVH